MRSPYSTHLGGGCGELTPALQSWSGSSAGVQIRPYSRLGLGAGSAAGRRGPWLFAGLATRMPPPNLPTTRDSERQEERGRRGGQARSCLRLQISVAVNPEFWDIAGETESTKRELEKK